MATEFRNEAAKADTAALRRPAAGSNPGPSAGRGAGFTLVEMLVTLSIVALLVSLLAPGVHAVRLRSRQFQCKMNLRSVAFDFGIFADPALQGTRGGDDLKTRLRGNEFWLETFQQSQYRIDEFWDWGGGNQFAGHVADLGAMACPEVDGVISLRNNKTCRQGAIGPRENISFAFNLRLDSVESYRSGMWGVESRPLSDRILTEPGMVPLIFDVDGVEAARRDITPHYSAPPIGSDRPYSDGWYWIPSARHGGEAQVAFVGGEVLSGPEIGPEANPSWRWDYQPR